jgi:hypothetical protein
MVWEEGTVPDSLSEVLWGAIGGLCFTRRAMRWSSKMSVSDATALKNSY